MVLLSIFLAVFSCCFFIFALTLQNTLGKSAIGDRIAAVVTRSEVLEQSHDLLEETASAAKSPFNSLVERIIGQTLLSRKLRDMIIQSKSNWTVAGIICVTILAALSSGAIIFLSTSMVLLSLVCAVFAAAVPVAILHSKRAARLEHFNAVLPDCIEMCARSLRAGHSLASSINIVAEEAAEPAKSEFLEVAKNQNHGLPLRDSLQQMMQRVPSSDLQVLVTAILVQKDTGGNLAEIMDRTLAVIRDRVRIQGDIKTHTAQGRLTGWILLIMPIVLMLIINLINPGYSSVLFRDPIGVKLLYAGLCLLLLGGFLIRQIVRGIQV